MQKMYDCFVRRTAEEDCCIVLHEKDTLGEIDLFARDIVSEYETKSSNVYACRAVTHTIIASKRWRGITPKQDRMLNKESI